MPNLEENWDACVAEVGEGTARVWGLYMAGSRLAFERNEIQLHHVLAVKTDDAGHDDYPLRPTFPMDATYPRLSERAASRRPGHGEAGAVRTASRAAQAGASAAMTASA